MYKWRAFGVGGLVSTQEMSASPPCIFPLFAPFTDDVMSSMQIGHHHVPDQGISGLTHCPRAQFNENLPTFH